MLSMGRQLRHGEWKGLSLLRQPFARSCLIQVALPTAVITPPIKVALIEPWILAGLLRLAPAFTPFDLQTYIEYHFTKVGDQTRYLLRDYAETGGKQDQPVDALRALEQAAWPP